MLFRSSSFPSSAGHARENPTSKLKPRTRPASMQVLSSLQPCATRLRKDSEVESYYPSALKEGLDREVKVRETVRERQSIDGHGSKVGLHVRTQSTGIGLGGAANGRASQASVRRASLDVVRINSQPVYSRVYTISPESSPHPSPSLVSSSLPSIPSPVSPSLAPVLPAPPHLLKQYQRVRATLTDSDRRLLARGAQDILLLHGRIVRRIDEALWAVQEKVLERKRATKGKERTLKGEKLDKERDEVECEVEAAVRAVCGVFVTEVSIVDCPKYFAQSVCATT